MSAELNSGFGSRIWLIVLCLALALGIGAAGASLYNYTVLNSGLQLQPSICNIGESFNCDKIDQSEYARLFGFPLASWGLLFYLSIAVLLVCSKGSKFISGPQIRDALVVAGGFALGFSLYLAWISHVVLGTYCLFCMCMYAANFFIFVASLAAGLSEPLLIRLKRAFRTYLVSPFAMVFGADPERARFLAASVSILLTALLILSLPRLFLRHWIEPAFARARGGHESMIMQRVLHAWRKAPYQEITVEDNGPWDRDYRLGSAGAPIEIVEFSDFECGHCRTVKGTLDTIFSEYSGQITWVLKHYPLDHKCNPALLNPYHNHACALAQLAQCAGEQGQFWSAVNYLFDFDRNLLRPAEPGVIPESIWDELVETGLDVEALKECLQSGRQLARVKKQIAQAEELRLNGTPSFWINGKRFTGSTLSEFRAVLDDVLGGDSASVPKSN